MAAPLSWYQYNYADISLEFRIDGLDNFFDLGNGLSQPYTTDTFGHGWSIECWPSKTSDSNEDTISCRLSVGPKGYSRPIFCSFIGRSATSGHCYFEYSATYVFDPDQPSWSDKKPHGTVCQKSAASEKRLSYRYRRLREEDALVITVNIRTQAAAVNAIPPSDVATAEGLHLVHSLMTAEEPCNRRFVAFLSRSLPGYLIGPHVYLCGEDVLRAKCPKLHEWTGGSNSHSATTLAHLFHKQDSDGCDAYSSTFQPSSLDYDSDSDFEEGDREDQNLDASGNNSVDGTVPSGRPSAISLMLRAYSDECRTDDTGYSAVESMSEISLSVAEEQHAPACGAIPSKATDIVDVTSLKAPCGTRTLDQVRIDRTMPTTIVTGVAASTWEAFLFYLYTGVIVFAPLTSAGEEARKAFKARYRSRNPHRPVPCSCKSIYRLAHQLDMADLEDLALKEIDSQLSVRNIVTEIFTKFTSRYDRVKAVEMHFLKQHWDEIKGSRQVAEMLMKVTSGRYPHTAPILTEIWQSVSIAGA